MKKNLLILMTLSIFFSTLPLSAEWVKVYDYQYQEINSLLVSGNNLFVGNYEGVYLSTDNGQNWTAVNNGLNKNSRIDNLVLKGKNIYAGTNCGVYKTSNNGEKWEPINNGLKSNDVKSLGVSGNNLLLSTSTGLYLSSNEGFSWFLIDSNESFTQINCFTQRDTFLIAGTENGCILRSTNFGITWDPIASGIPKNSRIRTLCCSGKNIYAGILDSPVYFTSNNGLNWKAVKVDSISPLIGVLGFTVRDSIIYAATNMFGVLYSTDCGLSWMRKNGLSGCRINRLTFMDSLIFGGTSYCSVVISSDKGNSWSSVGIGFSSAQTIVAQDTDLLVGTHTGIFRTSNNGQNWTVANIGFGFIDIATIVVSDTILVAGSGLSRKGIIESHDKGLTWKQANKGLTNLKINKLLVNENDIFALTYYGIFKSKIKTIDWVPINNGIKDTLTTCMDINGEYFFVGTNRTGMYISSDSGSSWREINKGLTDSSIKTISVCGSNIFILSSNYHVFKSTNNGSDWTLSSLFLLGNDLFCNDSIVLIATGDGVYQTDVNLIKWQNVTYNLGDEMNPQVYVYNLNQIGKYVFAITERGIYKQAIYGFKPLTNVSDNMISVGFSLSQNYPNPFNPSTTISFSLPHDGFVSLKIFNTLGEVVATLVSEQLSAGTYNKNWDASILPTGTYFYCLQSGTFSETKKLVLMR